jgi:hypothetical protein
LRSRPDTIDVPPLACADAPARADTLRPIVQDEPPARAPDAAGARTAEAGLMNQKTRAARAGGRNFTNRISPSTRSVSPSQGVFSYDFLGAYPLAVDRFGNGLPTSKQDSRISLTLNPGYLPDSSAALRE